jgi:phosphotransferase system enzyme I (PtsP)
MEDIGRRIVGAMSGNEPCHVKLKDKRIIIADEIMPSDLAMLDPDKILGIATERGDVTSHAAIMAKSLGIPAVVGVGKLLSTLTTRDELIIDGNTGHVFINPDDKVRGEYERIHRDQSQKRQELDGLRDLPAITTDGVHIPLRANIGLISDIKIALANGAEGVGLYRSEFPYMARTSFPEQETLHRLYRKVLEEFAPQPVTIRTLDIGGDKELPYFPLPKEDNPFLGWRSIRVCLDRQDIFRTQLAALLRAAAQGGARIMFPLINGLDEVWQIKEILSQVRRELEDQGHPLAETLQIGVMVETPAAVQLAHLLIREVDFLSIGTNDLVQYTLAADRNNPKIRSYYDPFHPAVLHSIHRVAQIGRKAGKSVSVCGEFASDPVSALLLIGMEVAELSLSAPSIPMVKQLIRRVSMTEAKALANKVLAMESGSQIRGHLEKVRQELELT